MLETLHKKIEKIKMDKKRSFKERAPSFRRYDMSHEEEVREAQIKSEKNRHRRVSQRLKNQLQYKARMVCTEEELDHWAELIKAQKDNLRLRSTGLIQPN